MRKLFKITRKRKFTEEYGWLEFSDLYFLKFKIWTEINTLNLEL